MKTFKETWAKKLSKATKRLPNSLPTAFQQPSVQAGVAAAAALGFNVLPKQSTFTCHAQKDPAFVFSLTGIRHTLCVKTKSLALQCQIHHVPIELSKARQEAWWFPRKAWHWAWGFFSVAHRCFPLFSVGESRPPSAPALGLRPSINAPSGSVREFRVDRADPQWAIHSKNSKVVYAVYAVYAIFIWIFSSNDSLGFRWI